METIPSLILLSLFLCATGSILAMQEEPIITLCSVKNSITDPDNAGHVECLVDGKTVGIVHSCRSSIFNTVLFSHKDKIDPVTKKLVSSHKMDNPIATIKRLNFELRHPKQDSFKELRLKLTFDRPHHAIITWLDEYPGIKMPITFNEPHLAIIKDLADEVSRPEEFHLLDDNKKYLLHVHITNDNQISIEMVEE